jgi:hypothetical protein
MPAGDKYAGHGHPHRAAAAEVDGDDCGDDCGGEGEDADGPIDESPLLQLHETAGLLLEEEEDLLNAHMHAIQECARQIQEEGNLLGRMQRTGEEGVAEVDVDEYAARLEVVLEAKVKTAVALLRRLKRFRAALAKEEALSRTVRAEDMLLA